MILLLFYNERSFTGPLAAHLRHRLFLHNFPLGGAIVKFGDGTSICLFYLAVAPRYLAFPGPDQLNDLVGIVTMLGHDVLDVIDELRDLYPPLGYALRSKLLVIRP